MLEAVCDRPPPGLPADISLAGLGSARCVVVGPAQNESIILRDSERALTLRFCGSRASLAPVGTTFFVRGIPEPPKLAANFRVLEVLLRSPHRRLHPSRDDLLFRDALVALDGRRIGASHRDAAEVIVGIKRVREEWSGRGGWLKERMRRVLAKGEELRDGGYRRALDGACRRGL